MNAGIWLIGPLGTNFSEILMEIYTYSFEKMHLQMPSGKWRPFCLCSNVLILLVLKPKYSWRTTSGLIPWLLMSYNHRGISCHDIGCVDSGYSSLAWVRISIYWGMIWDTNIVSQKNSAQESTLRDIKWWESCAPSINLAARSPMWGTGFFPDM